MKKAGVDLYIGEAELLGSSKGVTKTNVRVCRPSGCVELDSFHVCIATGSRAHRPTELSQGVPITFSKGRVVDSTEISSITDLPRSVVIIGGGVIAVEYATVLAELKVGVTLICSETSFLPFVESDLRRSLKRRLKKSRVLIVHLNIKEIIEIEDEEGGKGSVKVVMENDPLRPQIRRVFTVDTVVYSGGRDANSEGMGLENVNILTKKYVSFVEVNSVRLYLVFYLYCH